MRKNTPTTEEKITKIWKAAEIMGKAWYTDLKKMLSVFIDPKKLKTMKTKELVEQSEKWEELLEKARELKKNIKTSIIDLYEADSTSDNALKDIKAGIYTSLKSESTMYLKSRKWKNQDEIIEIFDELKPINQKIAWLEYVTKDTQDLYATSDKIINILHILEKKSAPQWDKKLMESTVYQALLWLELLLEDETTQEFTEKAMDLYIKNAWKTFEIFCAKNLNDQIIEEIKARKNK